MREKGREGERRYKKTKLCIGSRNRVVDFTKFQHIYPDFKTTDHRNGHYVTSGCFKISKYIDLKYIIIHHIILDTWITKLVSKTSK